MQNYVDWQFLKHFDLAGWFRDSYTYSVHGNLSGGCSFVDLVWPCPCCHQDTWTLILFQNYPKPPLLQACAYPSCVSQLSITKTRVWDNQCIKCDGWFWLTVLEVSAISVGSCCFWICCATLQWEHRGRAKNIHFKKPKRGRRKGWSLTISCWGVPPPSDMKISY